MSVNEKAQAEQSDANWFFRGFLLRGKKAQASFELLLVAVIIVSLALLIHSYFFTIFDATKALAITKLDAIEKLSQLDSFYTIKKIDFIENNDNTISLAVYTEPALAEQIDFTDTEQKIISQTKYSAATVTTG